MNKTNQQIALEVIAGQWGNGLERRQKLENAGYNYGAIQSIVNAVMTAMKDIDNVSVVVTERYYEVSPSPGKGAAIAIGRAICKSGLGKCCVQIPKLFSSFEVCVEKEKINDERE